MKRKILEKYIGTRIQASGKIERFGCSNGCDGKLITLLIVDMYAGDEKKEFIDHCWIRLNKKMTEGELDLKEGDYISFTASVALYTKAPHYEKPQGYRLKKVRDVKILRSFGGTRLKEFIENMKDIGKEFSHQYEAI